MLEWMLMPLRRCADFTGRSRRKEYWMFVLGVLFVTLPLVFLSGAMWGDPTALTSPIMIGLGLLWLVIIVPSIAVLFVTLPLAFLSGTIWGDPTALTGPIMILLGLLWLVIIVPSIAVQVRRFHDQEKAGWFVLLNFIPYLGSLIVLVFMCIEGTRGPNRYGPDPKSGEMLAA